MERLHYKTGQFIAKSVQAHYNQKRQELITQLYDLTTSLNKYMEITDEPEAENGWSIQIEMTKAELENLQAMYKQTITYLEANSSFEMSWLTSKF